MVLRKKDGEKLSVRSGREYMNKLIAVAIIAIDIVEGAKMSDRYYFRVSTQRINALRQALEALKE